MPSAVWISRHYYGMDIREHGSKNADDRRQAQVIGDAEGNIRAHHDDITMGKVQHLGNTVDHGITQGDDSIHGTDTDTVDQIL